MSEKQSYAPTGVITPQVTIETRSAQPNPDEAKGGFVSEKSPAASPADAMAMRQKILALEGELRNLGTVVDLEVTHHFANGIYAREIFVPKGTALTGKIHKTDHINIISQGEISVMTEDGIKRLKAPCTLISRAGLKRAGYAHEDTVWTTIHATPETNLDKLEADLIAPSFEEYLSYAESLKIEGGK
jgi:hypothetical protein